MMKIYRVREDFKARPVDFRLLYPDVCRRKTAPDGPRRTVHILFNLISYKRNIGLH